MGKENGEQTKTRAVQDPEIKAMGAIARILGELSEADRGSVVAWVGRKYAPVVASSLPLSTLATRGAAAGEGWRSDAEPPSVKK